MTARPHRLREPGARARRGAAAPAAGALRARATELAAFVAARHWKADTRAARRHGAGREGSGALLAETAGHLLYLVEAVAHDAPALFRDYTSWVRERLDAEDAAPGDLLEQLDVLCEVLGEELPAPLAGPVLGCLDAGCQVARAAGRSQDSFLAPGAPHAALARGYLDALLAMERREAVRLVLDAAEGGVPIDELYLDVFQPVQREVGRLWQRNRISIAVEHYCTAATQLAMAQLYPRIAAARRTGLALVAVGVEGDLHELGIRMVSDFFEMAGWNSTFLGTDVPAEHVADALLEQRAPLLAVSVTLAAHVSDARTLIERVRARAGGDEVCILVGGPPFAAAEGLWSRVGADGTAADARETLALARTLFGAEAAP